MSTTTTTRRGGAAGTGGRALPGGGGLSMLSKEDEIVIEAPEEEGDEGLSRAERRKREKERRRLEGSFENYPHLMEMKPDEGYVFKSDYFVVDGTYACVLGFFHSDGARDGFPPFWGISKVPSGLPDGVVTVLVEQVRRRGEKWVDDHLKSSERLDKMEQAEQGESGTRTSRRKADKVAGDMEDVAAEIQDGASYLHVQSRLIVKAPTLEALDRAVSKISSLYVDRMGTLSVAPYHGEQRQELSSVFAKNEDKRGKGEHYTSVEYAGSYDLVTNGLNDPRGEYVGFMTGDINSSGVLFDVDGWDHRVVVADSTVEKLLNRAHYPDMWGSKISQSALLENHKVVHLVLDGADLDKLGPKLDAITARMDMSTGDINMFEMFGEQADELSIFPAHLEKIVLMAEQAYETTDSDRSIIRGSLRKVLTQFYIDKRMWRRNAKADRDKLRLVGIPHEEVPRLQDIVTYFDTGYKEQRNSSSQDANMLQAYSVLSMVFRDLLENQGDLFNTHTKEEVDSVSSARRVVYDFSKLRTRGEGIAMAQLVNVIGFAVGNLSEGDVVIIHGTENIDEAVKPYVTRCLEQLAEKGGRVALCYNSINKMLDDREFNEFSTADWTILGPMDDATVSRYQDTLKQSVPTDLERLITSRGSKISYLRRGHTNVVFTTDLALGINPAREERRIAAEKASQERHRLAVEALRHQEGPEAPAVAARTQVGTLKKRQARRAAARARALPDRKAGAGR